MSKSKQGFWMVEVYTKAGRSFRIPIEGEEYCWITINEAAGRENEIFLEADSTLNGRGVNIGAPYVDYIAHRWIAKSFDDYLKSKDFESKEDFK